MSYYIKQPTLQEKVDVYEEVLKDISDYHDFYSCIADREVKRESLYSILNEWTRSKRDSKADRHPDEQSKETLIEFDRLRRREYAKN